jgi:hypothetical protein
MRGHRVVAIGLLILTAAFGWAAWDAADLARRFPSLAKPRPPDRDVAISVTVEASKLFDVPSDIPNGTPIASFRRPRLQVTRRTLIEISYHSPIDITQTASISARLSQSVRSRRVKEENGHVLPNYDEPVSDSDPYTGEGDVVRLPWDVTLSLGGLGFDWTQNDILIKINTPLAVTEKWAPRAKEAGDYVLRFPLKDINHAAIQNGEVSDDVAMTINREKQTVKGSDDVLLPISVHKDFLPAFWFQLLLLLGAGITGLSAILAQVFGEGWGGKALKWLGGRRHATPRAETVKELGALRASPLLRTALVMAGRMVFRAPCSDPESADRDAVHAETIRLALDFFTANLRPHARLRVCANFSLSVSTTSSNSRANAPICRRTDGRFR